MPPPKPQQDGRARSETTGGEDDSVGEPCCKPLKYIMYWSTNSGSSPMHRREASGTREHTHPLRCVAISDCGLWRGWLAWVT